MLRAGGGVCVHSARIEKGEAHATPTRGDNRSELQLWLCWLQGKGGCGGGAGLAQKKGWLRERDRGDSPQCTGGLPPFGGGGGGSVRRITEQGGSDQLGAILQRLDAMTGLWRPIQTAVIPYYTSQLYMPALYDPAAIIRGP